MKSGSRKRLKQVPETKKGSLQLANDLYEDGCSELSQRQAFGGLKYHFAEQWLRVKVTDAFAEADERLRI